MRILLDPGHGLCPDSDGNWEYARPESYGVREDLVTPRLAGFLASLLEEEGHEVHLTRPLPFTQDGEEIGDSGEKSWKEAALFWSRKCWEGHPQYWEKGKSLRGKSINARPLLANFLKVDLAVSLHINASSRNDLAHGVEVWSQNGDQPSADLSQRIYDALVQDQRFDGGRGTKGNGTSEWEQRHSQNLAWFRRMKRGIPSALVEFLFFTNKTDASMLNSPDELALAAESIFHGIQSFVMES